MNPNLSPVNFNSVNFNSFEFGEIFAIGAHVTDQRVFMRDNVPACTGVPTPRRDVQNKTNHQHRNLQGEA